MKKNKEEWNALSEEEQRVILKKGTERAFTGEFDEHTMSGTYICRQCENPLYRSVVKFEARCGWPAFDDEIEGAVKKVRHPFDNRIEIVCNNCDGHLGHVFTGERLTEKNTRHCVNSISMLFVED
jgi:methionine-R-sulfoxide reductase